MLFRKLRLKVILKVEETNFSRNIYKKYPFLGIFYLPAGTTFGVRPGFFFGVLVRLYAILNRKFLVCVML